MIIVHGSQPLLITTCRPLCDFISSEKRNSILLFSGFEWNFKIYSCTFQFLIFLRMQPCYITLPRISQNIFAGGFVTFITERPTLLWPLNSSMPVVTGMVEELGTRLCVSTRSAPLRASILPTMEATLQHGNYSSQQLAWHRLACSWLFTCMAPYFCSPEKWVPLLTFCTPFVSLQSQP